VTERDHSSSKDRKNRAKEVSKQDAGGKKGKKSIEACGQIRTRLRQLLGG